MMRALSAAAALVLACATSAVELTLRLLNTDAYPRALCNDGTASGFYHRLNPSSNMWIVHQEG